MTNEPEPELFPELDEELLKRKMFPVLVRPNLGQPEYISAKNFNFEKSTYLNLPNLLDFEFDGLIAACDQSSIDEIFSEIDNRVFIYPLSDTIVDGRAVRLNKIPITIKEIRRTKIVDIKEVDYEKQPQIYLESEKIFPGREVFYFAKFIFRVPEEVFYKTLEIGTEKITTDILRKQVLCDIVYDLTDESLFNIDSGDDNYIKYYCKHNHSPPNNIMRINYHALVLTLNSTKQMESLKIWQASDLHIAARNDKIPHSIFKRMAKNGLREKDIEKSKDAMKIMEEYLMRSYTADEDIKLINDRIKNPGCFVWNVSDDDTPYLHDPQDLPYSNDEFFWQLPIEYRAQNCNNNLRMFIFQANDAYKRGELDFIVFTGDLVDFVSPRRIHSYEFKFSNWKVLLDILLGKPHKIDNAALLPPEEILVPIYTIPGNHDYRGHSYPPGFGREMLGFTDEEMKLYPSSRLTYLRSLAANIKYLRGYFQFINPDLNFAKKFGKNHFLFIDTDKDSMKDLYDLLRGSPSTKGFRNNQMKWLYNYCDVNVKDDERVFLFTHSPPINPPKIEVSRGVIEKLFPEEKRIEKETGEPRISIYLLKEYTLIDKMDDPRIDTLVNLKFGTIVNNWEEMLSWCTNCRTKGMVKRAYLVCSGHTHKNLEFRLQPLYGRELQDTPNLEWLPFRKLKIPCAIYLGNYSEEYEAEIQYLNTLEKDDQARRLANHNLITHQNPFLVHTTALGPRSQREYSNLQCFRKIIINENRLDSFKTEPLLRFFAPFELVCEKRSS